VIEGVLLGSWSFACAASWRGMPERRYQYFWCDGLFRATTFSTTHTSDHRPGMDLQRPRQASGTSSSSCPLGQLEEE